MGRIVFLGTAHSIADEYQNNTHLLITEGERAVIVDCVGYPLLHIRRAGVDFNKITDLILTHFHPDHVSGVPLFLMDMWLLHRQLPLRIHGLSHTIERAQETMKLYGWESWANFYPVSFFQVEEKPEAIIIDDVDFRILSSPMKHLIPTIGLRMEFRQHGKSVAYSSDTEPCEAMVNLAKNTDILIHEATGTEIGHSNPSQAGMIAQKAEVGELYLIHYPPDADSERIRLEASQSFTGKVTLAKDQMEILVTK